MREQYILRKSFPPNCGEVPVMAPGTTSMRGGGAPVNLRSHSLAKRTEAKSPYEKFTTEKMQDCGKMKRSVYRQ
jgi:hypothetical protein